MFYGNQIDGETLPHATDLQKIAAIVRPENVWLHTDSVNQARRVRFGNHLPDPFTASGVSKF